MEPIRILHIVSTMDFGGVETLLMSIYRCIDREKIQFDFLCHNRIESEFKEEILSLGGKMYMIKGPRHIGPLKYYNQLRSFFNQHSEYSIIHAHMNRDSAIALLAAENAGIPVRVAHSHVAGRKGSIAYHAYEIVAKQLCRKYLTKAFACSKTAGRDLFGDRINFDIVHNGICVNKFEFDDSKRNRYRDKIGIEEGTLLIGHVGRFSSEKNHRFLIECFKTVNKQLPNSKLLLVGDGELKTEIESLVKRDKIDDKVIFVGSQRDVCPYYCAMDIFVFPSLYEGLGIVAVEAQACGLPVIASEGVPIDSKVIDSMKFISLDKSCDIWATKIINTEKCSNGERKMCSKRVAHSLYNIIKTKDYLQTFYINSFNKLKTNGWTNRTASKNGGQC